MRGILKHDLGICGECKNLFKSRTFLNTEEYKCTLWIRNENNFKSVPNKIDPIVECDGFYPKLHPDLNQMYQMATIISIRMKTIGFGTEERTVSSQSPDPEQKIFPDFING